jgi:DNA-binding NarL/FixJ family response regulator
MADKRVLLVEDHPMTRMGLKLMLDSDTDYCLAAEAGTGQLALAWLATAAQQGTLPHLVLMDIGMPDMDGIETTQRLKALYPGLPVLMLTSKDDATEVKAAMAAGANGYCLKGLEWDALKVAMDAVTDGNAWLDKHIAHVVLHALQQPAPATVSTALASSTGSPVAGAPKRYPITERELEVLRLIVEGYSNPEISDRLYISIATTKAHVHSILQKLCLDDRTQAAVWALRNGIA